MLSPGQFTRFGSVSNMHADFAVSKSSVGGVLIKSKRLRSVFVTVLAVCFGPLLFTSDAPANCANICSSFDVVFSRGRFDMLGVDASAMRTCSSSCAFRSVALMVDVQSFRNRLDKFGVGKSVHKSWDTLAACVDAVHSCVAFVVKFSDPQPAASDWIDHDQTTDPIRNRKWNWSVLLPRYDGSAHIDPPEIAWARPARHWNATWAFSILPGGVACTKG